MILGRGGALDSDRSCETPYVPRVSLEPLGLSIYDRATLARLWPQHPREHSARGDKGFMLHCGMCPYRGSFNEQAFGVIYFC